MKDFLLLSTINAITYKDFFPLLKEGKVRGGYNFNKVVMFETPEGEIKKQIGITWFTTLPTPNKKKLILTKRYKHDEYPHYDNYRAIEVGKVKDIPYDYECMMGVPITIFGYDLDNVEIIGDKTINGKDTKINGKEKYRRVLIKKKIEVQGIWNDKREEADFIVKGTPTYIDEKHKSFQGPVVDGKAKYSRVLIKKKIVIMGMAAGNSAVNDFGSQAGYRKHKKDRGGCPVLDDEIIYARILIRNKRSWENITI